MRLRRLADRRPAVHTDAIRQQEPVTIQAVDRLSIGVHHCSFHRQAHSTRRCDVVDECRYDAGDRAQAGTASPAKLPTVHTCPVHQQVVAKHDYPLGEGEWAFRSLLFCQLTAPLLRPPLPASTTSRSLDGLFTSANGSMQLRKEDQSSRNRFRLRFRKSMYNWASVD